MTSPPANIILVAFDRIDGRRLVCLSRPGEEPRQWRFGRTTSDADADALGREIAGECEGADVFCYDAEALSTLLSRPAVLPFSRKVLGHLRDLRELAMLMLPLEPEYSLEALCPGEDDDEEPSALERTGGLLARVGQATEDAGEELLDLLKPFIGHDSAFSWLPWPEGPPGELVLNEISRVLPSRPSNRKRSRADSDFAGDLRDLSVELLSPGGAIEEAHPGYEHRAGQIEMAAEVAEALRDEKYLLVEAGTGVGKSLAYLVPAILWSVREGEPVVVSTNTKNLQEQLIDKDLPLLTRAMPVKFEAALLKGRANYPCIRNLVSSGVDAAHSLLRGERLAVAYMVSWLAHQESGDLGQMSPAALELLPELGRLITRVRSQADSCLGRTCSHFDHCPVQVARTWARRADIVVSNHALTFEDTRAQILPPYTRIIFDEAQNVESVATDNLSLECSSYGVSLLLRSITEEPNGFVGTMTRKLETLPDAPGMSDVLVSLQRIPPMAEDFSDAIDEFGEILYDFCFLASNDARASTDRASVRLVDELRETHEWGEVTSVGETAIEKAHQLLATVEVFTGHLGDIDKEARPGAEGMDLDAEAIRVRIHDMLRSLTTVLRSQGEDAKFVTWAEGWTSRFGSSWSVNAAPVDIGPILDEAVYQHKSGIVFTSATISVDGKFDYYRQRVGLDKHHEKLVEIGVPSPFDLKEQLLLCVPCDMPDASDREYADAVVRALGQICEVTEGGTLALFTARSRMKRAFEALEDDLRSMDLTPLCQDVSGPRSALLDRLKQDPRTILFGLKSFWEGVDVPGDALRCVVICKLPFAVPSDPIIQARQEDVARKGMNPMHDYYIPEAIVGFKQGFGRLIRTTTDTGAVFVLDRRILTKGYGRRFFQSIQRCELSREPLEDCLARAAGWLGTR